MMPLHPEWPDIFWRIVLTVVAGVLVGMNHTEHEKAAGIRTVMLVCLAASFAMILANAAADAGGGEATVGAGGGEQVNFLGGIGRKVPLFLED